MYRVKVVFDIVHTEGNLKGLVSKDQEVPFVDRDYAETWITWKHTSYTTKFENFRIVNL